MIIAITGKSGILSQELQKIEYIEILDSFNYDITSASFSKKVSKINPDIIIHAGAITDSNTVNQNPTIAINTNIIGTANVSNYCIQNNKRLVYISTDYVFGGDVGNYKETDSFLPYNKYAWTKLGGECSVQLVPNHLIIRTSFGPSKVPYEGAWVNQRVSKDYIDIIAPMILKAVKSDMVGVLNIGTKPKTLYEYASKRNKVKPIKKEQNKNFTLNVEKYEQSFLY
jgi:dTDP-4-dehydrorhamnose reductase